jgi:ribosomal protein S18 acetylase RimI-like enzyme
MSPLLDNIMWNSLAGAQAAFAVGSADARRYAPGFSPILGFADLVRPNFDALRPFCAEGEHFYVADWSTPAPSGWAIEAETTMHRMVWDAPLPAPDDLPDAIDLRPEHAAQALELATLTRPGPFGPRTIELGEYVGCFDAAGRLVAMAGERMHAGSLREVSGVCTHPEHQGRGLARRLMTRLVRRQLQRGETPFLHVMSSNAAAHALYLRMGFRDHAEPVVRVVTRT